MYRASFRKSCEMLAIGTAILAAGASASWAVPFQTGDIFAAVGNGQVQHYDSTGSLLETLDTTNGGFTTGMAFDGTGNLYVTNFTANRIAKFDTNGSLISNDFTTGGALVTPESIVFDNSGNMYVGNVGNGIQKFDSSGNFIGTVTDTRVDFFDLTADQSTFRFGQEGDAVKTVSNAIPGTLGADFATGLSEAFAMRILPDDGMLVADDGDIKRLDSTGTLTQTYDVAGVDGWFALNLGVDGTSFWSGSFNDGVLRLFDIDSEALTQSIDTGCGSQCLFGVAIAGEITVGGPGPGPGNSVPEPAALLIFSVGLVGVGMAAHRRKRLGSA